MKTVFLLMAEFNSPTIPLDSIRERYFNVTTKAEADRKAKPVEQMGGTVASWREG